jgi:glycosyltransferase involved in cell wall biosynthesis
MLADFPRPGQAPVGGPQVAVRRLVAKLVKRGVEVVVVAPDTSRWTETMDVELGVDVIAVPRGKRWTLVRGMRSWRRNAADVVYGIDPDIVHGQELLAGGIAAADIKGFPIVVTARGSSRADTTAAYRGLGRIARVELRDRLARGVVRRADIVIGVNPDWTVNLPGPAKRFVYIPNMIDEQFFDGERKPEPGVVLFAGGARAIKGWMLLAEAWPHVRSAVPGARLNVVGWPSHETTPGIPAPHQDSVAVEGWLSSSELAERMRRAAALVIPSQFEVSPIVLAEAWALRLPVVAVPVGGIPALATGAAVLVKRQPDALAAGIVSALAFEDEVKQFVDEGRARAEAHRPDAVAKAHMSLYDTLRLQWEARGAAGGVGAAGASGGSEGSARSQAGA